MRTKSYRRFVERKFKRKSKEILNIICLNIKDVTDELIGKFSHCHNRPKSDWRVSRPKSGNGKRRSRLIDIKSKIDYSIQLGELI